MSTYKVKVLGVQGLNNKVFGPNEIVTEAHFPAGNAKILEKEGKLELVKKEDSKKIESKKETESKKTEKKEEK